MIRAPARGGEAGTASSQGCLVVVAVTNLRALLCVFTVFDSIIFHYQTKIDILLDCAWSSRGHYSAPHVSPVALSPQESEGISCHYWSLFDGHAGSGAAVVASRLLQHHITQQLQEIVEILKNSAILPPTCLGEEPESTPVHGRTLTRAASLRGGVGAPGSPSTPPTRFFTEKKIPHECLVIGALESAFKEMVRTTDNWGSSSQSFLASKLSPKLLVFLLPSPACSSLLHNKAY